MNGGSSAERAPRRRWRPEPRRSGDSELPPARPYPMQNAVVRVGILLRIDQHAAYSSHRRLHTVVPAYQAWWSALLFVLERVWLPGTVSGSLSVPHSAMEEVDKGVAGIIIGEGEQGAESAPNVPLEKLNLPGELSASPPFERGGCSSFAAELHPCALRKPPGRLRAGSFY